MTETPPALEADYSTHELLHMAWVVEDMFARYVMEHPALEANPEWKAMAQEAHDRLWALYQAVGGEKHLPG